MPLLLVLDETATSTGPAGTVTAQSSATGTLTVRAPLVGSIPEALRDSFTDTTGTLLTAHTGESGGWTQHPASAGDAVITNAGRLRQNGASVIGLLHFAGAQPQAEYDVAADFVPTSSIASSLSGIVARLDPSANTLYLARYSGSAGAWQILKLVNGSATTLATSSSFPLTASQAYRVTFQIRNATKKIFVDGVEVASTADNAITGAGRAGVRMFDSSLNSDASSMHIDNLAAVSPSGSVATGLLTARAALTSTVAAVSTVTGTETVIAGLIGASAAVSTATGTLGDSAALRGVVAAQSDVQGTLANLPPGVHLIGSIPGSSTVAGTVSVTASLVGTAAAVSALTGQAAVLRPLVGAITASSLMVGDAGPPIPRWDVTPAAEWASSPGDRWDTSPATTWDVDPSERWELING